MAGDELDQFINRMLEDKRLSGLSDDVRVQLVDDLKHRLVDQINRALISALPDDKMDEFNSVLDNQEVDDSVVQQFMVDSGVDIKRVTTETMLRFYDLYVSEKKA